MSAIHCVAETPRQLSTVRALTTFFFLDPPGNAFPSALGEYGYSEFAEAGGGEESGTMLLNTEVARMVLHGAGVLLWLQEAAVSEQLPQGRHVTFTAVRLPQSSPAGCLADNPLFKPPDTQEGASDCSLGNQIYSAPQYLV